VEADGLRATTKTKVPLKFGQRHTTSRMNGASVQDVRIYSRVLSATEVARVARGARAAWLLTRKRTPAEQNELFDGWLATADRGSHDASEALARLQREEAAIRARGTVAHVSAERTTKPSAFILYRGDYDKRRDEVGAATPAFLPPMPGDLPRNRLGFA